MEENKTEQLTEQLPSLANASSEELAHAIFDVLDAKKAKDIRVLHVREQTVICTGQSNTQIKALGGEAEYKLGLRGVDPQHFEGRDNNNWVVVDYGTVILHIFSRESREFYKLEKLYGDAEEIHYIGIDEKAEQSEEEKTEK